MKSAFLALSVAITASACGLFERKGAPEQTKPEPQVVAAVSEAALVSALPQAVADWASDTPQSSSNTAGNYQLARAIVSFGKDIDGKPAQLTVEIVDGTHVPSVKSQLALLMHGGGDVHQMALAVGGHQGMQHWQPESGTVGGFVIVAGRFLVKLNGRNVPPQVFRAAADAIDVKKLEALAGVAPREQPAPPVTRPAIASSAPPATTTAASTAPTSTTPRSSVDTD